MGTDSLEEPASSYSNYGMARKLGGSINTAVEMASDQRFNWRESSTYIYSSATGVLDLVSTTIAVTGAMTVSGALTVGGLTTANGGVTLGAGDSLIGSATSDITMNTNKFTVAGATGNTVVAGTLAVTGLITATGGVTLAANQSLTISGTGIATTTGLVVSETTYTASGAIAATASFAVLTSASGNMAMTIAAPAAGRFLVIRNSDTKTNTVTLSAGTYNGTAAIATFDNTDETLVLFGTSTTRFVVVQNIGSVGIS